MAFGKKPVYRGYRYSALRVQRFNAAQQDVGIDKKAHLSAIRINRLTADCFVGQNRCGMRMASRPKIGRRRHVQRGTGWV